MMECYRTVGGDMTAHDIRAYREMTEATTEAMDYIIALSGNYRAALRFLRESGVKHRLNDSLPERGMDILSGLEVCRGFMRREISDLEFNVGHAK